MARDERLDAWMEELSANLMALEFRDLDLDFTDESLRAVEAELLDEYDGADAVDHDDPGEQLLIDAAAGYLGEALLRLTGGGWGWRGGEPVLQPDPVLQLAPQAPARLVGRALDERTGRVFTDVVVQWAAAAARHRAAHPGWAPQKEHTSGVDAIRMSEAEAAYIAGWTAQRQAAFPAWVAAYGTGTAWTFAPESLDALEELLLRFTPTSMDLYRPENAAFVDGAVWYLGELIRGIRGGRWVFRETVPGRPNMFNGQPYVEQAEPSDDPTVPVVVLSGFLSTGERGALRARYVRCGGE